jgi:hypothetical protein
MSYLDPVRLVFHGDFQADVSTVNNDVRHFDTATFDPRFQKVQEGLVENGWWHPTGSNAFRLLNCGVRAVHYADGTSSTSPEQDAAVALLIGGSNHRVSGKLVDLDPQWQLASQIWGLEIRLTDESGKTIVGGRFEPSAFRDILFGRQKGAGQLNGQGASAMFQSVLSDVQWTSDPRAASSRFLRELRHASAEGTLSIRLTTFGYFTRSNQQRFTLGTVTGVIGPFHDNEPKSFILGRRFAPANSNQTTQGVSFFNGKVDATRKVALVDLSNAIPLTDPFGAQADLGVIELAILKDASIAEGQTLDISQFVSLGEIPYRDPGWLAETSGIFSAPLDEAAASLVAHQPMTLLLRATGKPPAVLIRETKHGLVVRAEQFVQRLDAGQSAEVDLFAAQFGLALANTKITAALLPPQSGLGGGSDNDPKPPKAPIPDINVLAEAVSIPAQVSTDSAGRAPLKITTSDPKHPRGYVDGQIYLLQYSFADTPDVETQSFDYIIIYLRDTFPLPDKPSWQEHVAPILAQYSNLYPVMNERIVDLTSYDSVRAARAILELAFSLPISDPNHMPVTRDLSDAKRATILRWLREKDARGNYVLRYGAQPTAPPIPSLAAEAGPPAVAPAGVLPEETGGKTDFLRSLPPALKKRGQ